MVTVGKESRAGWAWYLVANGIGVGVYYLFAGSMALMLAGDIVYAVQEATGTWVDNSWPDPYLDRLLRPPRRRRAAPVHGPDRPFPHGAAT